jgi:hypothetical protein
VEGDDAAIAAGARYLLSGGDPRHPLIYRYDAQPGCYWMTVFLSRWLSFSAAEALAVLSGLSGLIFILLCVCWASRATGILWSVALFICLLWQEVWTTTYFGNSTVIAAPWATTAILLLEMIRSGKSSLQGEDQGTSGCPFVRLGDAFGSVAGGLSLGLATVIRFDACLVLPAALWLAWSSGNHRRKVLAFFLGSWLAGLVGLGAAMNVSALQIMGEGSAHLWHFAQLRQSVISGATWLSLPGMLLVFLGVQRLVREGKKAELTLAAAGILPGVVLYGWNLTTPKYLLYSVPFLTRLAAYGWQRMRAYHQPVWNWIGACFLGLTLLQYLFGPLSFLSWLTGRNFAIAGTHDGPRRLDSVWLSAWEWHRSKMQTATAQKAATKALERTLRTAQVIVLSDDWFSASWIQLRLLERGYSPVQSRRHFPWIAVPHHHDFILFMASGGETKPFRSGVVACFETEWLESVRELPGEWTATWELHLRSGQPVEILFVSGRRGSRSEIEQMIGKLPGLQGMRVLEYVVLEGRPWVFRITADLKPDRGSN